MNLLSRLSFLAAIVLMSFSSDQGENIEFACFKTHKASNSCHFNFTVDGARYRYVDIGCKYSNQKDVVIKKVKEGSLALAKDWKIDCPPVKDK